MGRKVKEVDWEVNENGCWVCISHHKNKKGYPQIWHEGKLWYLHRVVYEQLHGKIPDGYVVRHTCDNPSCIHPDHLVVGTPADNARDRDERGRFTYLYGESNGSHKLTENDVRAILADTQHTNVKLGKMFGVSDAQISSIKNRRSWKHITTEAIQ